MTVKIFGKSTDQKRLKNRANGSTEISIVPFQLEKRGALICTSEFPVRPKVPFLSNMVTIYALFLTAITQFTSGEVIPARVKALF